MQNGEQLTERMPLADLRELAEQHIRKYESHLIHLDELMARARAAPVPPESRGEFKLFLKKRDTLANQIAALKYKSLEAWREDEVLLTQGAGPMLIWEVLAQQIEKLIERLGG